MHPPWPVMPKIVVTGGGSSLAWAISTRLADSGHHVSLSRRHGVAREPALSYNSEVSGGTVAWSPECSYEADDATAELFLQAEQLVLVDPALPSVNMDISGHGTQAWLDICTRCVYNILTAAANTGVKRAVVLGSMEASFMDYPPTVGVLPNFKPLPTSEPASLGPHLSECVL